MSWLTWPVWLLALALLPLGCAGASPSLGAGGAVLGVRLVMRTRAGTEREVLAERPMFNGNGVAMYVKGSAGLRLRLVADAGLPGQRLLPLGGDGLLAGANEIRAPQAGRWLELPREGAHHRTVLVGSYEPLPDEQVLALARRHLLEPGLDEVTVAIDPEQAEAADGVMRPRRTFRLRSRRLVRDGGGARATASDDETAVLMVLDVAQLR